MDALNDLARKHGLKVLEDACQAYGASYRDRRAGTLGHLGAFSSSPPRTWEGRATAAS